MYKYVRCKYISISGYSSDEKTGEYLHRNNDVQTHFVAEKSANPAGDDDMLSPLTHMVPTSPGKSWNFTEILKKSWNFFEVKQSKRDF